MASLALLIMVVMAPALVLSIRPYTKFIRKSFDNDYHGSFTYTCENNENLAFLSSVYSKSKADRRIKVGCRPSDIPLSSCRWRQGTSGVNGFAKTECYGNGVIAGMQSSYDANRQIRKVHYQCCYPSSSFALTECKWTPYQNKLHGNLKFHVPLKRYLAGVQVKFSESKRDRQAQFKLCSLT